jgi:hypothetical protein
MELDIKQALASGSAHAGGGPHQQLMEWATRTLDQIVLAHSHASGGQVGAGSQTMNDKAAQDTILLVNGILRRLTRWLTDQFVRQLVIRNFGAKASPFVPELVAQVAQQPDYLVASQVLVNVRKAGLRVDPEEASKSVGFSVVEEGDAYVGNEDAQQAGAPGAADPPAGAEDTQGAADGESEGGTDPELDGLVAKLPPEKRRALARRLAKAPLREAA